MEEEQKEKIIESEIKKAALLEIIFIALGVFFLRWGAFEEEFVCLHPSWVTTVRDISSFCSAPVLVLYLFNLYTRFRPLYPYKCPCLKTCLSFTASSLLTMMVAVTSLVSFSECEGDQKVLIGNYFLCTALVVAIIEFMLISLASNLEHASGSRVNL